MKKKSLQKFTDYKDKVEWLFALKKIKMADVAKLNKGDKDRAYRLMNEKINSVWGDEREKFIEQFSDVWHPATKNQLWENNHTLITGAICNLMLEYNRMPNNTELAEATKLSRTTIHKHLQEYSKHPIFLEQTEQFRTLIHGLMARVYKMACRGDVGAAKLFFNVMGCLGNGQVANNTAINTQNNYIQINGTILSQETIKQLSPKQIKAIEAVLNAIPKHK